MSDADAGALLPCQASKWPEIDRELSAYVQTIRADLIEQCAKIAESEPATHAERCIAAPYAVRSNAADRIRALANSREPASIAQASPVCVAELQYEAGMYQSLANSELNVCIALVDEIICRGGSAKDVAETLRSRSLSESWINAKTTATA